MGEPDFSKDCCYVFRERSNELIEIFSVNSVDEGNPAVTSAKDLSLHDILIGNHHFELVRDPPSSYCPEMRR